MDTRIRDRVCKSLAQHYRVILIAIGNESTDAEGIHVVAVKKPGNRITRVLFTSWKVFFLAIRTRARIYHIHDPELLPFGILLALVGKQVIYDIHENTRADIRRKKWIPGWSRWLLLSGYHTIERIAARLMHFVPVVANESLAARACVLNRYTIIQNFASYASGKAYTVLNRAELPGNHLFYCGTLSDDYYDLNKVIDALAELKLRGTCITLHCIGFDTYYKERELNSSRYHEVADQVLFYGQLSFDAAYKLSMQCKAGLCLKNQTDDILLSHERKFFEYHAVGLPMLTCNATLYKDIVEQEGTGITANLSDTLDIAAKLAWLFEKDTPLNAMALQARNIAMRQLNWESQEQILLDLYGRLLRNQNA